MSPEMTVRRLVTALALVCALGVAALAGASSASAAPTASTPVLASASSASSAASASVSSAVSSVGPALAVIPAALAVPVLAGPAEPTDPTDPAEPEEGPALTVDVNGVDGTPASAVTLILAITFLSVAPALLLMTTSFTKIIVVLSITRNALGLASTPPNQVLAGLALFLSLFIMTPVITDINDVAIQPYLEGSITQAEAIDVGEKPLRTFMLAQTRDEDLALITRAADRPNPQNADDVPMMTLVPSFVLSELRAAFIIGFVIFVPFLVIDIVTSASLMAMGMMMLPPVTVSLPFKLLLFVLVNGWGLILTTLIGSYR